VETINYKGFTGSIEVSYTQDCVHGKILFINDLVTYEAPTPGKIKEEFELAVEDYIETCKELGIEPHKSFNGTFNIRIKPKQHEELAFQAIKNDETINKIVNTAISNHLEQSNQTQ
jgi:predicted HicB family RNase H-like nuclease